MKIMVGRNLARSATAPRKTVGVMAANRLYQTLANNKGTWSCVHDGRSPISLISKWSKFPISFPPVLLKHKVNPTRYH